MPAPDTVEVPGGPDAFLKKIRIILAEGRDGFPRSISELSSRLYGLANRTQLSNVGENINREKYAALCNELNTSPAEFEIPLAHFRIRRRGKPVLDFKNRGFNRVSMARKLGEAYRVTCGIGTDVPGGFPLLAKRDWLRLTEKLADLDIADIRHRWFSEAEFPPAPALELALMELLDYGTWVKAVAPGTRFDDLPAYRLGDVRLTHDGRVELDLGPSRYKDFADTCNVLELEFAEHYQRDAFRLLSPQAQLSQCRLRMEAGKPRDPLDLKWRNAVPGVNTLFVLVNVQPGEHHFFYHDRTPRGPDGQVVKLAEAQGTKHVVPAGTFQSDSPIEHHTLRDRRLERTVWREFAEELIGEQLVKDWIAGGKDFLKHPLVAPFYDLRAPRDGTAPSSKIFYLGVGLDPLTLKPEILTLMVVDERRIKIRRPDGGFDIGLTDLNSQIPLVFGGNWEGKFDHEYLNTDTLKHFLSGEETLPAGAAVAQLALLRLGEIEALFA
jgi:hypothetical protein